MGGYHSEEKRDVLVGFFLLFGVLVSHGMLETARDTLFLSSISASRLPWVYLAIAILTYGVAALNRMYFASAPKRSVLASWLWVSAVITLGFWFAIAAKNVALLYVFYIWTGLMITLTVSQFWALLADRFSVAQAKRAYGMIGAGGLVGATTGSLASAGLLQWFEPRGLLLASPIVLLMTSSLPMMLSKRPQTLEKRKISAPVQSPFGFRAYLEHPYARHLVYLVLITTITLTFVELTFKTVISERISKEYLGTFFALFYGVLNGIALIVQVLLSSWILRKLGVNRAMLVLPSLIFAAAVGFLSTLSLVPVLLLKLFDGTLRHSLNRTSSELLYVPLPPVLRARARVFVEGAVARLGQGVASLVLLALVTFGVGKLALVSSIVLLSGFWVSILGRIRGHYIELFRQHLRAGSLETRMDLPELDLNSLETIISTLNSPDSRLVIKALDFLEHYDRVNLVPALILYHPSKDVVLRGFQIFADAKRKDFLPIAKKLLEAEDDAIRAAALRGYTAVVNDEKLLRKSLTDPSTRVRTSALVAMSAGGYLKDEETLVLAHEIVKQSMWCRVEMVRAVRQHPTPIFDTLLRELAEKNEPELLREIALFLTERPDPQFISLLFGMLPHRAARAFARNAMLAIGEPAFDFLRVALQDTSLDPATRRHIPRTLSRFKHTRAARCLLERFMEEKDSVVAYKILRGLGRLVQENPYLNLDSKMLNRALERAVRRGVVLMTWRAQLQDEATRVAGRATWGNQLLVDLFKEKERHSIERVFRLLGLIHPFEDFEKIYRGLMGKDEKAVSSSLELIEHLVQEPVRSAVIGLGSRESTEMRLKRVPQVYRAEPMEFEAVMGRMLRDKSDAIRILSAHYISELRLAPLVVELRLLVPTSTGLVRSAIKQALSNIPGEAVPRGA